MKIKNLTLTLLLTSATALALTACNDFLDRDPLDQFTEDDAPNALVGGKMYNVYYLMRSYDITAGIPAFLVHMVRSEDSEKGSDAGDGSNEAAMWDDFQYTASDGPLGAYWGQNYKIIYQCNEILDDIAHSDHKDDLDAQRTRGEALFFRAYCYFNLVRAWGEVPLVTAKVVEAADANVPKTTADKIYQQIDADLTEAAACLPPTWSTEYTGRITWGAVRSLHARTYMMRNDWNRMYDAATDVIHSGLYNLNTPVDEVFTDQGENCGASILELQCEATAAMPEDTSIGSQFCQIQGVRGAGEWDLGWGWHMATPLMGDAFEPGDPRRDATLLYFRRSIDEPITPANTNKPWGESPVSTAMGAYFNKKAYTSPLKRQELKSCLGFWVNIRLIRYPDVLLMAAEAANEKGLSGEALGYLEQVRAHARGTLTDVLPRVTTTNQTELRNAIRHERRVELALEPDRFYDLVRWDIAKEVLQAAGKNYQDKNALLPLPQTEIDKSNGVLVQNPDY
ncbi:MAG: RagB/SusD family nutrient uptake outer membrane protein [Bacteroides sp.]|nr:RagB/SusD family nutrient uptake outer membrane protein [Bacteroides sp.]